MTFTLTDQHIKNTYTGLLHTQGEEIPSSGQVDVYDGSGNKTPISIGREGEGLTLTGPVKLGELEYPTDNSNTTIGAVMVQTSANKLELQDILTIIDLFHPIGSIYMSLNDENPKRRFVGTDWERVADGRFLVGVGTGTGDDSTRTFTIGNNPGRYTVTLRESEMPSHTHMPTTVPSHPYVVTWTTPGIISRQEAGNKSNASYSFPGQRPYAQSLQSVGGNQPHENTPPGYGVYMWKRIS